jgi:hypothetical protein
VGADGCASSRGDVSVCGGEGDGFASPGFGSGLRASDGGFDGAKAVNLFFGNL